MIAMLTLKWWWWRYNCLFTYRIYIFNIVRIENHLYVLENYQVQKQIICSYNNDI